MTKRRLKIAYISHFNYGIEINGISAYNEKYLKNMVIRGHKIDFYTIHPKKKNYSINPLINYYFIKNVPKNPFYYSYFQLKLPFIIDSDKYDIIHTTCGSGFFLKNLDFTTFHHFQRIQISNDFAFFHYIPIKFEIRKARHIIAVSQFAKEQCIKNEGRNPENVSIINQGIDCERFKPRIKVEIRKQLNLPLRTRLGIFVGYLEKRKNPILLINIAKQLKNLNINAKIIVIGKGPLKTTLLEIIKEKCLSKAFLFFDSVPLIELFYNAADIAIVPSILEGFGLIYIESVASGIPFIGFRTGISDQIAKQGFGIIAKNETDFIQKTIEQIQNPILIGEKGYKFIKENYSEKKCVVTTEKLYYKYLENK